jgi:transcriptional/translational regulatory protein YebC/TACO1
MSGHSKWSTIKHKKAANDARRSKAWSKLTRYVAMAARSGGGDPDANARLRLAPPAVAGAIPTPTRAFVWRSRRSRRTMCPRTR